MGIDHVRVIVAVGLVVVGEIEAVHRNLNLEYVWLGILGDLGSYCPGVEDFARGKDGVAFFVLEADFNILAIVVRAHKITALDGQVGIAIRLYGSEGGLKLGNVW